MERLLMIDDDRELCEMVAEYMQPEGFKVETVHNGEQGLERAKSAQYALILLDVMLPGMSGFDLLRRLRASSNVRVLLLTARGEEVDRIVGLEIGADDYLPKPFDPRELILRINNILRRGGPTTTPKVEQLVFGPYTFQIARRELKRGGEALKLTDREQEILAIFAARAGETIPRHELVGDESDVGERTIDVQINRLRRKIERDPSNPVWLQTVRGIGYRLSVE